MEQKGYISEFMNGARIVSHGKIENLTQGFKLPNGQLFSIYVRPQKQTDEVDTILSLKCYQDEVFSDAPLGFYNWSPMAIAEIAPNNNILNTCDLYWGSGSYIGEL